MQRNKTIIVDSIIIWKDSGKKLMKISNNKNIIKIYEKKNETINWSLSLLANLVNPKYMGKKLNEDEIDEAMDL